MKLMLCGLVNTSDQKKIIKGTVEFIVDLADIISPRMDGSKEREMGRCARVAASSFWVVALDQYALENTQTTRHSQVTVGDE